MDSLRQRLHRLEESIRRHARPAVSAPPLSSSSSSSSLSNVSVPLRKLPSSVVVAVGSLDSEDEDDSQSEEGGQSQRADRNRHRNPGSSKQTALSDAAADSPSVSSADAAEMPDAANLSVLGKRRHVTEDPEQLNRNRRMFAGLLGHLSKAQTQLQQDRDSEQGRRKRAKLESVRQRLQEERQGMLARGQPRDRESRRPPLDHKTQQELRGLEAERRLLRMEMQAAEHALRLARFLVTTAEPPLCWTPARPALKDPAVEKAFARRLETTQAQIAAGSLIDGGQEELKQCLREIEHAFERRPEAGVDQPHFRDGDGPSDDE